MVEPELTTSEEIERKFPAGARVDHIHHGKGTVDYIDGGVRHVTFDSGAMHRFAPH